MTIKDKLQDLVNRYQILPNNPGVYRFFYEENIDGNKVLLMATFELE